jgi:hypothetical protein
MILSHAQTLALVQQGSAKGKGMGSGTGQGQGMGLEGEGQVALSDADQYWSKNSSPTRTIILVIQQSVDSIWWKTSRQVLVVSVFEMM